MAGYSSIFCIGGVGGFQGCDGINPINLQIFVGNSDRMWLESHYVDRTLRPIGKIRIIIPEVPDSLHRLLDACIAFAPKYFQECPSLEKVKEELRDTKRLDFDSGKDKIPASWESLRKEATPIFEKLNVFEAKLSQIDFNGK